VWERQIDPGLLAVQIGSRSKRIPKKNRQVNLSCGSGQDRMKKRTLCAIVPCKGRNGLSLLLTVLSENPMLLADRQQG
jgi:hypothetical protein